ncbi:MAG: double-strand break repair helicase AddA [Alphaproteobacteria bacterium]|nr:double-strand break repair helicase AddA [Alphaproteobacteria bacterium]
MNAAVEQTVKNQRLAANPAHSAIVAANAGAGKTRVLTDRVARLLLEGTPPSKILCITYTKAAAAEMAGRLFELLGGWALADDDKLAQALKALEGESYRERDAAKLAQARRLFARALETPGGLKIQTIHSFCESVLKRFPLEAGVAPGFAVIDESAAAALSNAAIDEAALNPALAAAFDRLSSRFEPDALRRILSEAIRSHQKWDEALLAAGGWRGLLDRSAQALGAAPGETAERIVSATLARFRREDVERAHKALHESGGNPRRWCAVHTERYLAALSPAEQWRALQRLFIKTNGAARDKFGSDKTAVLDAWVEGYLIAQQRLFIDALEQARAAENLANTSALVAILEHAFAAYERAKAARAGLDYDDLIIRVETLFRTTAADWVRYKLDQGLDHILLDEAQDTSPGQWRVVEGPLEEFLAGQGARETNRTFFAVGDQKQSIYSFQGADANLFAEKQQDLGKKIAAVAPFENAPLTCSFRSSAPVLRFVDALFAREEARQGVDTAVLSHGVKREGAAGLVELWPLTPRPERAEANAWDAPVDAPAPQNPTRVLTDAIADKIKSWLDNGEELHPRARAIRPSDIMILVQGRSALFHEMIKRLAQKGVPVAGADRLMLLDDAGVQDLLSYARAALFSRDDLSLAEILKSPFFGLDEASLFDLAHHRRDRQSLWGALRERANERPEWERARAEIEEARAIGLRDGAFAFLSHILETGAPSGKKRLFSRLGEASAEPVNEFLRQALDYELANPRSLQGFLAWAEKNAVEIKRDMEERADAVRVMTVHGAKGLEAEIVFLLDAHRLPVLKNIGPLFFAPVEGAVAPLCSEKAGADSAAAAAARLEERRRAYEEYRRLLYVAATRARDRLYICGLESGANKDPHAKDVAEKSWHALAEDAFGDLTDAKDAGEAPWGGKIRRLESGQTGAPERDEPEPDEGDFPAPGWLFRPARHEDPPKTLAPSRLADEAQAKTDAPAFSPLRRGDAFLRGRVLHRLLELLPDVAPAARRGAADRLLTHLAPETDETERALWREEALAVLADLAFAPVFAEGSRAEAAIGGVLKAGETEIVISGQIDRLAVDGARVLVVDYKTNRPPPKRVEDIAPAYIAQLAAYRALLQQIYPDREIDCALLWTYEARLTPIPSPMLDHALARALGAP